jgi:hypothetical protein
MARGAQRLLGYLGLVVDDPTVVESNGPSVEGLMCHWYRGTPKNGIGETEAKFV